MGIMLLLYVKADLALNISEVEIETVGTGIMGRMVRMATMHEKGGDLEEPWRAPRLRCSGYSSSEGMQLPLEAHSPVPVPAQGVARGNCHVLAKAQRPGGRIFSEGFFS